MKQGVGWHDGKSSAVSKKIQIPGWVSGFFDLPGKSKGRYGLHSHFPIYQSVQPFFAVLCKYAPASRIYKRILVTGKQLLIFLTVHHLCR